MRCIICYSTPVIPFRLSFEPGISLYEQVVYAAKKAMISGQMRPGDPFPSVRALSKALKINPNTAHKVVTQLVSEGLIEVRPGLGTVVAELPASTAAEAWRAPEERSGSSWSWKPRRLGLDLDEVTDAVARHWDGWGTGLEGASRQRAARGGKNERLWSRPRDLVKRFRQRGGAGRSESHGARGQRVRPGRTEWRGQNHHHQDFDEYSSAQLRPRRSARHRFAALRADSLSPISATSPKTRNCRNG